MRALSELHPRLDGAMPRAAAATVERVRFQLVSVAGGFHLAARRLWRKLVLAGTPVTVPPLVNRIDLPRTVTQRGVRDPVKTLGFKTALDTKIYTSIYCRK